MPARRFIWVAMWLLVCVTVASGQTRRPPVTVAVMAGDDAPPAVEIFAAALTPVLRDRSITMIDRSQMRKLLAEHELSVDGVMRDPLAIGQMTGAQYLIYLTAPGSLNQPDRSQRVALMLIEVNSGNVLAESVVLSDGATAAAKTLGDAIDQARQQAHLPAATVLNVIDRSGSHRMRFFQASLQSTLDRMLEQRGWRMLRRNHALELSKETTLSTAGLMRPDAEVLARAADLVVSAEFREQPAADKAFEQTPIELTLSLRQHGKTSEKRITFTLDALSQLERELNEAIPTSDGQAAPAAKVNVEEPKLDPRLEAAQLLGQLDRRPPDLIPWDDRPRQAEMCRRIVYLDPSLAEGYYWLGVCRPYRRKMAEDEYRALIEESRYALTRYLQFPRTQAPKVRLAFYYLEDAIAGLTHQSANNSEEADRLCEQALAVMVDYINWFTDTDQTRKIGRYETLEPMICTNFSFRDWFDRQPKRYAEYCGWLADRVASNASFPDFMVRTAEMNAAGSYDHVGDLKVASEYFYRAASRLQKWNGKYFRFGDGYGRGGYATTATVDRYAKYYTDEQRELLKRLLPEPSQEKPWVRPMPLMYGEYFGSISNTEGMIHDEFADAFWLQGEPYAVVKPEPISGPAGVVFMPQLFRTRDGLWAVGVSGASAESVLTYGLYQWPLKDGKAVGAWRPVTIPQDMAAVHIVRGRRSPVIGALQIAMMVQVGDELLWCGGAMAGGKAAARTMGDQSQPLFVYDLKTRQLRTVGLAEGLPEKQVVSVHPEADGQSAWIVTEGGFLTRYHEGKLYLVDRRYRAIGWTFTSRSTFALGAPAEHNIWMGKAGGDKMREVLEGYKVNLALLPGSCFRVPYGLREMEFDDLIHVGGDGATALGDGDSFVVRDGCVYLPCCYGLLVMGEDDGRINRIWRKNLFCNFRFLAGFVEGNSPLPPAPIVKVVVDEQQPKRLWIISRHKYMVERLEDTPFYKKQTGYGDRIPGKPVPGASGYVPSRYASGLFITAFDTDTQKWSKPIFVDGEIASVAAVGDAWVFAGTRLSQLPKSMWVCDQEYDADAKPKFVTADTLHGRAARALFDGDFVEARRLLSQAIDEGIAVEPTRKTIEQLDAWERDHKR
ncbi:MAG: hypothetical protein ACYC26_13585 [Phycisphaerales bacterium]